MVCKAIYTVPLCACAIEDMRACTAPSYLSCHCACIYAYNMCVDWGVLPWLLFVYACMHACGSICMCVEERVGGLGLWVRSAEDKLGGKTYVLWGGKKEKKRHAELTKERKEQRKM